MIPVNYLAILLCGVSAVAIGFVWFGPLFGKAWMQSMGMTMPSPAERNKMGGMMLRSMGIAFVAALITAYVLAHSLIFAGVYLHDLNPVHAWMSGFWNWLGYMMPVVLGAVLWERKTWKWFFITAGYYLVNLVVMAYILACWPA